MRDKKLLDRVRSLLEEAPVSNRARNWLRNRVNKYKQDKWLRLWAFMLANLVHEERPLSADMLPYLVLPHMPSSFHGLPTKRLNPLPPVRTTLSRRELNAYRPLEYEVSLRIYQEKPEQAWNSRR